MVETRKEGTNFDMVDLSRIPILDMESLCSSLFGREILLLGTFLRG